MVVGYSGRSGTTTQQFLKQDLFALTKEGVLGGSWVVISRVISRATVHITHIGGLMTPLITTHEPPSRLP